MMVSNGAICIKRKSHRVTPISDRCIGRIKYCYYARRLSSWPDAQHLYSFALHGDSTDNAKTVITIPVIIGNAVFAKKTRFLQ